MDPIDIDVFVREKQCEYKGRVYYVRDNGAVYRRCQDYGLALVVEGLASLREPFPWISVSNHRLGAVAEPSLFVFLGLRLES